jgi:hypothetical protein
MRIQIASVLAMTVLAACGTGCASLGGRQYARLADKLIPGQSVLGQNTPFLGKPVDFRRGATNLVTDFISADEYETAVDAVVKLSSLSVVSDLDGRVQRVLPSEGIIRYATIAAGMVGTPHEIPTDLYNRVTLGQTKLQDVSKMVGDPCRIGLMHAPGQRIAEWFFAYSGARYRCEFLLAEINADDTVRSLSVVDVPRSFHQEFQWRLPPRPSQGRERSAHPNNPLNAW